MTTDTIDTRPRSDKTSERPDALEPGAEPPARVQLQRAKLNIPPEAETPPPIRPLRFPVPVYYALPVDHLLNPPLKWKGQIAPDRLSVFEFSIFAAVLGVARFRLSAAYRKWAFEHTGKVIADERETAKRHLAALRKNKSETRRQTFVRVGQATYKKGMAHFRRGRPPETFSVCISSGNLLAVAHADRHFGARLLAALDRLTRPVRTQPPLLASWRQDGSTLTLEVTGAWLKKRFLKVPPPLPSGLPHVLALYLFAIVVGKPRYLLSEPQALDRKALHRKLCINPKTRVRRQDAIRDAALDAVNAHLSKHREQHAKLKLPGEYKIVEKGGRVETRYSITIRAEADQGSGHDDPDPNPIFSRPEPPDRPTQDGPPPRYRWQDDPNPIFSTPEPPETLAKVPEPPLSERAKAFVDDEVSDRPLRRADAAPAEPCSPDHVWVEVERLNPVVGRMETVRVEAIEDPEYDRL